CFDSFALNVVAALDWIVVNNGTWGIDVVNASVGTNARFAGDCDSALAVGAVAVDTLRAQGVTVVASAGNDSSTTDMTAPACLRNVISVGAATLADTA